MKTQTLGGTVRVAWRNLWRNGRRSLVTIAAMTLALLAMVVYSSLMRGLLGDMERNLLEVEVGDVQIHAPGYLDEPSLYDDLVESERLLSELSSQGYPATARYLGGGLAAAGDASAGVQVVGLDPEADRLASALPEKLREGEWLSPDDPSGVVIGSRLARTFGVTLGSELVLLGQTIDGGIANDLFVVRGILTSFSEAVDRAGVFVVEEAFRSFFAYEGGAQRIIVRRRQGGSTDDALAAATALAPDQDVQSWRELQPTAASMLDAAVAGLQVMMTIVYVAIAILILNAMLMAVFERIKELGLLKALGMSPTHVLSLILLEAGLQTLMAVAAGLVLAVPILWYLSEHGLQLAGLSGLTLMGLSFDSRWYSQVDAFSVGVPVIMLVVIVSLAVLYPGLKGRATPTDRRHAPPVGSASSSQTEIHRSSGVLQEMKMTNSESPNKPVSMTQADATSATGGTAAATRRGSAATSVAPRDSEQARRRGTRLWVMAWRNLWRNRRRTVLTLSSIVFGVFLAIIATAMQDQNWADMIDLAARLGGGHVSVQHQEYVDHPTLTRTVQVDDTLLAVLQGDPEVRAVMPRVLGQIMLATAGESAGAGFIAYDPSRESAETLSALEAIAMGEPLDEPSGGGILLGARIVSKLGLDLGDRVIYTLTDTSGEIVSGLARLQGVVETGSPAADSGIALLPIDALRDVVGLGPDQVTQLAIFLEDQRRTDAAASRLSTEIASGAASGAGNNGPAALPWYATRPELAGFIALKVGGARFMEILIAILVAAGIFNTLFVSVMERMREFGILSAIGWSPGKLFSLVMLESFWMALLGLVGAAIVTVGPYFYLANTGIDVAAIVGGQMDIAGVGMPSVLKVGIFFENLMIIVIFAVLATLLSGVYPAWRAGRVEPVETLKLV